MQSLELRLSKQMSSTDSDSVVLEELVTAYRAGELQSLTLHETDQGYFGVAKFSWSLEWWYLVQDEDRLQPWMFTCLDSALRRFKARLPEALILIQFNLQPRDLV